LLHQPKRPFFFLGVGGFSGCGVGGLIDFADACRSGVFSPLPLTLFPLTGRVPAFGVAPPLAGAALEASFAGAPFATGVYGAPLAGGAGDLPPFAGVADAPLAGVADAPFAGGSVTAGFAGGC